MKVSEVQGELLLMGMTRKKGMVLNHGDDFEENIIFALYLSTKGSPNNNDNNNNHIYALAISFKLAIALGCKIYATDDERCISINLCFVQKKIQTCD
ncbi:hypothetical protein HN51_059267 [Arachis hypogaea]